AADRELPNGVQGAFPLEPRPYAVLAERLGTDEADVRARVARVKELGVLRQLSAIFDTRALGYGSSLVAAKIDPDRVDEAAAVINAHPGVSHNYKRNHAYNLWYTIAVPPGDSPPHHHQVLPPAAGARAPPDRRGRNTRKRGAGAATGGDSPPPMPAPTSRSTSDPSAGSTWRRRSCPTSRSPPSGFRRRTCRWSSGRSPSRPSRSAPTRRSCSACCARSRSGS